MTEVTLSEVSSPEAQIPARRLIASCVTVSKSLLYFQDRGRPQEPGSHQLSIGAQVAFGNVIVQNWGGGGKSFIVNLLEFPRKAG